VNVLDVAVLVFGGLAALGGWRTGFLSRVLSWFGLAAGVYFAVRFLPSIVKLVKVGGSVPRVALAVVVLLGGAFLGQAVGLAVGARLRRFLPFGGVRTVDRAVGAGLGVVSVLAGVWLLAPSLAAVPGSVSQLATGSVIARWVSDETHRVGLNPPDPLQALRQLVGQDGFPQVFDEFGPSPYTGKPPATDPLSMSVLTAAEASTVKVYGEACGLLQEGSGWTVAPNLVVTNAHVVAGEKPGGTEVLLPNGSAKPAQVVEYNPDVDLALLSVPDLGEPTLQVAVGAVGQKGAVLGHPNGQGPLAVQPAIIADLVHAEGEDLYNTRVTYRDVYVLAAQLAKGDSGAPLVDKQGKAVGIAFAIAPDRSTTSYALSIAELAPLLRLPHDQVVGTQACVYS